MKKYIIMISAFIAINAFSQTNCQNNVSTDPDAPTNDALPSGPDSDQYLNGFNWIDTNAAGIHLDYETINMNFAGVPFSEMNNIMVTGLEDYNYIADSPLHLGSNGWELLLVNLGYYPDYTTELESSANDALPYIVLYNRYSGTVRVFVNFGLDHTVGEGPNAMEVELKFPYEDEMNGAFRLYQGHDQALDQASKVVVMTSVAIAPAVSSQWASTDFKIAYDPCTCYYPSDMRLNFTQIKESTLKLHSRTISLENQSLIDNTTLQVNPTDFLSGFDYTGADASGGVVIYKTIEAMIEDYRKKYEEYNEKKVAVGEHNKKVKINLAMLNFAKLAITLLKDPIANFAENPDAMAEELELQAALEATSMSTDEIEEAYGNLGMDLADVDWFKVVKKFGAGIVKLDGYGSKIIDNKLLFAAVKKIFGDKGETFIANNFEPKEMPKKPSTPTATFSETHYEGQILDRLEIGGPQFYTPGTYGSMGTGSPTIVEVEEYPVYNEVMGVFALLESPKITISESVVSDQVNQVDHKADIGPLTYIQMQRYQSWTKEYQVQLKEDLKFAFNDVLDINSYEIKTAFNIVATPVRHPDMDASVESHSYNAPDTDVNFECTSFDLDEYVKMHSDYDYQYLKDNPNYTPARYEDTYIPAAPEIVNTQAELQTEYLPIDAFKSHIAAIGLRSETVTYGEHHIPDYDLDTYDYEYVLGPGYQFDLSDPRIEQPEIINPYHGGYKYEFVIELKLIVDVEFNTVNSEGHPNRVTEVLTYKVNNDDITWQYVLPLVTDLADTDINIGQYPFNGYFEDVDFHGQEVEGCTLSGTHYTCRSVYNTTIQGDLTTSGGYTVDIIAGHEIEAIPASTISPEITLFIDPLLDYSDPMPQVDLAYVESYCTGEGKRYAANEAYMEAGRMARGPETDDTFYVGGELFHIDEYEEVNISLYPNPANELVTVQFDRNVPSDFVINIVDISGKLITMNPVMLSSGKYELDISDLAPGVYFVNYLSGNQSLTKRLVVR